MIEWILDTLLYNELLRNTILVVCSFWGYTFAWGFFFRLYNRVAYARIGGFILGAIIYLLISRSLMWRAMEIGHPFVYQFQNTPVALSY